MIQIDRQASFVQFLYPFTFNPRQFVGRCENIEAVAWRMKSKNSGSEEVPVWEPDRFEKEDLLAHVEAYLNPRPGTPPTARLWKLPDRLLQSLDGLGASATWTLHHPRGELEFRLNEIKLALFCDGVGFLTVCANPKSEVLNDWLDFVHFFRSSAGQREVCLRALRKTKDEQTGELVTVPFFPLVAGGVSAYPNGEGPFADIIVALLQTAQSAQERERTSEMLESLRHAERKCEEAKREEAHASTESQRREARRRRRETAYTVESAKRARHWWREVFVPGRLLPFTTLFADGLPEGEQSVLLFRIRKGFHASQAIYPTEADLRRDHPAMEPYAQGQWFTFSLDGAAFVAFDAPSRSGGNEFFRGTLPAHLRDQYFLLFLLVLHQRFALMRLSEQVAENWPIPHIEPGAALNEALQRQSTLREEAREAVFHDISDALLLFAARGHFVQAMQRENHHRCYLRWQETFQVEALYREVSDEVREMNNYLLNGRAERIERSSRDQSDLQKAQEKNSEARAHRLGLLGIFIGVPALMLSFLGINIRGLTSSEGMSALQATGWGFGGGLLFSFVISLVLLWIDRARRV